MSCCDTLGRNRSVCSVLSTLALCVFVLVGGTIGRAASAGDNDPAQLTSAIRTPKPPATPRINGPLVFGVRPGYPFLYRIPATGDRPMEFSVGSLPTGLQVDANTGQITGSLKEPGEYLVTLRAKNALGAGEKKFKIVVGETIALTPPMGWNSWNAYHGTVTGENVIRAARAMASSGLIDHGWAYINLDDAWQKERGGSFNAIGPNEKFPDFRKMCDEIHGLGLKVGIYSTPWTTSYARYIGGSSDDPNGAWSKGGGRRNMLAVYRYVECSSTAEQQANKATPGVSENAPPLVEAIGVSTDKRPYALVDGTLVYEGSIMNGFKIVRIHADKVEFEKDGQITIQTLN
ncbi:MAG: putative Ig domain-containing protein [Phycisphaerae bacterium]|nr:putative Ig domain-containing protein [Phycisphaerae bacterium]